MAYELRHPEVVTVSEAAAVPHEAVRHAHYVIVLTLLVVLFTA